MGKTVHLLELLQLAGAVAGLAVALELLVALEAGAHI
jgi:hypothetical protein